MVSEELLNQTYETINNIVDKKNLKEDSIENLGDILFLLNKDIEYYISKRRSLNHTYINVWEESIKRRLLYFPNEVLISLDISTEGIKNLAYSWRDHAKPTAIPLKFGQIRIAQNFAGERKGQPLRVQKTAGQPVNKITDIKLGPQAGNTPIAYGHAFPIYIFPYGNDWITMNNRGLTAHCFANIQPRRFIPTTPDPDALNRLKEKEDSFRFTKELHDRGYRDNQERTLPSDSILISKERYGVNIVDAACIPRGWI